MDTWDKFTSTAKKAAGATAKKAGELTNAAKLRIALAAEEDRLKECYEKIGQLYYDKVNEVNVSDIEIAGYVGKADAARENIRLIKGGIEATRRTVVCKCCGAKMSKDCDFCPKCGYKK